MQTDIVLRARRTGDLLSRSLDLDGRSYWQENGNRISVALAELESALAKDRAEQLRLLDVGPAMETLLISELFPKLQLETMGWADHRYQPQNLRHHYSLDLNETIERARCPVIDPVDIVLLFEVIEHVHVSPAHVLRYLASCLKPGGHLLVSTPNAARLRNRWRLLCGHNPFELIREDPRNPGHFRELTEKELSRYLVEAGFDIVSRRLDNLYRYSSVSGRWFMFLAKMLPARFRHDMLFTARKRVPTN